MWLTGILQKYSFLDVGWLALTSWPIAIHLPSLQGMKCKCSEGTTTSKPAWLMHPKTLHSWVKIQKSQLLPSPSLNLNNFHNSSTEELMKHGALSGVWGFDLSSIWAPVSWSWWAPRSAALGLSRCNRSSTRGEHRKQQLCSREKCLFIWTEMYSFLNLTNTWRRKFGIYVGQPHSAGWWHFYERLQNRTQNAVSGLPSYSACLKELWCRRHWTSSHWVLRVQHSTENSHPSAYFSLNICPLSCNLCQYPA